MLIFSSFWTLEAVLAQIRCSAGRAPATENTVYEREREREREREKGA